MNLNNLKGVKLKNKHLPYLINYQLFKKKLPLYYRAYKIIIKDIGCNAKCPMCIDWKNKGDLLKIKKNLYKVIKNILKDKVKNKYIHILGGEPLLIYNDLLKIIKIGKKFNIEFEFPTNGYLLNIYKINKLIESGLKKFVFSIDFPNKNHDKWRILEGSFKKIIFFTKYLKKKNITVQWNTVVGKFNLEYMKDFSNIYKEIKPNIHNFIYIHNEFENLIFNEKNILKEKEKKNFIYYINNINIKNIEFNINGFHNEKKELINDKCYLPLNMVSYIVNDKGILNSMCHYHGEVKNKNTFIKNAINRGCNKCETGYKYDINLNLSKIINN